MRSTNATAGPDDQLQLRIGINLGDVVESGDDLMGDAVNVAVRLESIAPVGGICVSASIYEQIVGKLTLGAEDMGEQHVKNIPRPTQAYRRRIQGGAVKRAPPAAVAPPPGSSGLGLWIGAAAVLVILVAGGVWLMQQQSQTAPPPSQAAQPRGGQGQAGQ